MWIATYGERAFGPFDSADDANLHAAMLRRHADGLITEELRDFARVRVFHVESWDYAPKGARGEIANA